MVKFKFKLARRFVTECGVKIMRVVTLNPSAEFDSKLKGAGPYKFFRVLRVYFYSESLSGDFFSG